MPPELSRGLSRRPSEAHPPLSRVLPRPCRSHALRLSRHRSRCCRAANDPRDTYPWLREHGWTADGPSGAPARIPGYHVVAFTTVTRRAGGGPYARRVWFVKADDRAAYGDDDWPLEAVDPMSIAPRRASRSMGVPPWRSQCVDSGREEGTT